MPQILKSLFAQVVIALVLGVLAGLFFPDFAVKLKPLGDGFIKLIKMIIPVLVFCVVVHGICRRRRPEARRPRRRQGAGLLRGADHRRAGARAGAGLRVQAGRRHERRPVKLDPAAMSAYASTADKLTSGGTVEFLMKLIPTTVVNAFATGDVLQVLLFAVLFGCALALLGERGRPVAQVVDALSLVLFKIMGIIIKLAPLGVLGAIAFTVGQYGIGSLKQLGMLVALFYVAVLIFVFVVLGLVMRLSGFSLVKLLRYLREELTIVFATTSSDSVLPQIMAKLRHMGIRDSTVAW